MIELGDVKEEVIADEDWQIRIRLSLESLEKKSLLHQLADLLVLSTSTRASLQLITSLSVSQIKWLS